MKNFRTHYKCEYFSTNEIDRGVIRGCKVVCEIEVDAVGVLRNGLCDE